MAQPVDEQEHQEGVGAERTSDVGKDSRECAIERRTSVGVGVVAESCASHVKSPVCRHKKTPASVMLARVWD